MFLRQNISGDNINTDTFLSFYFVDAAELSYFSYFHLEFRDSSFFPVKVTLRRYLRLVYDHLITRHMNLIVFIFKRTRKEMEKNGGIGGNASTNF